MSKQKKIPDKYRKWIEAREKYRLSNAHIQMAQELGMNPKKFGSLSNYKQETWKLPLPEFIEECYYKRFKKNRPDRILSIEERLKAINKKKEEKHFKKLNQQDNSLET